MSNENSPAGQPESSMVDKYRELAATKLESANTPTPAERTLWKGGYSAKAMYGVWLLSVALTAISIIAVALFASHIANIWYVLGGLLLLWWTSVIGTYVFRRLGQHYELTTQRFIHQNGVLVRRTDRFEVIDIEDVSYTQGIIQRMLGVGDIMIRGKDESHPELLVSGVDKVPEIASLIDDVRRDERRRRSLHMR